MVTNKEFSMNSTFAKACRECDLEPSKRQASKYRRKIGKVYKLEERRKQKLKQGRN